MLEGFVETKAGRIWYSVYGEHQIGTPLLVVHGGPGFLSMPQVISEFADERPVYFYDQLGSGKSDRTKSLDDYSVDGFVQELEDIRTALKLSKVILMGFSWGAGLVSAYMLDKNPTGVAALILSSPYLSTPLWVKDTDELISRMPEDRINIIEKGRKDKDYGEEYQNVVFEYYRRHLYCSWPFPNELMEAFHQLNQDVYGLMWGPSEFELTGKLADFDLYPNLNKISVPVLLTCGDRDELDVSTLKTYQMTFPVAQMAVLPNSGHMHHLEQPEVYKEIVRRFLATDF